MATDRSTDRPSPFPTSNRPPRVVVVGAGFGGLALARALGRAPVEVVLVDRENYHLFQPLLYQVATAGLEPEEIAHAVRGIFQGQGNLRFRLGEVTGIDRSARRLRLADGDDLSYDVLVLAAGASTDYFGVEGAERHGFALKRLGEAVRLRGHLIRRFEEADRDPVVRPDGGLTFAVVGGGPTGVETAGALVELFQHVFRKDYPRLPVDEARVVLLEASPRLLGGFSEPSQAYALEKLRERGVEVILGDPVTRVTSEAVTLRSGRTIPTQTLVWAAGVRANPLAGMLGVELERGGRVPVEPDLRLRGDEDVYVVGDMAASRDTEGRLHPQLAPVAMQGARHVARQIRRRLRGLPGEPFRYRDRGIMATIGRNAAVAEIGFGVRTRGFVAWLSWLFLHLVMLIGFRNRLNVLVNWAWNYVTYDRSARLILGAPDASLEEQDRPRLDAPVRREPVDVVGRPVTAEAP